MSAEANGKMRILCVEDHADTSALIQLILQDYEITVVGSVGGAYWLAAEKKFDLYLLDYHLPDGTGGELCRLLRSIDGITPILFVTGTSRLKEREAYALGAQGLIRKGYEFTDKLPRAVQELLAYP